MKQILQHLRTGELEVAGVPCPQPRPGSVLIRTRQSLISAGTERMLVEFSQANLLQKARQQPEKVKQVLDKMRTDGLVPTLEAVFRKLDEPLPLGYCNVGAVLDWPQKGTESTKGDQSCDFCASLWLPGTRVVSNGPHAEVVCVPRNLCAKIPDRVTDEQAAFTVLGAIALQGIRLAQPTLGETFMVFGLGLIGLLTVQLLRANGCEVIGVDLNPDRLALAEQFGARTLNVGAGGNPVRAAEAWTQGIGVDAALITASAKTDEIVHQAAQACRKRGRIVLVGVVGLNLRRSDFYEKELTFQVSCSYGPGRYDEAYEQKGQDYPIGYVRWTEQRNFEAVLAMLASGRLNVKPLITHRFRLDDAVKAYETIRTDPSALGVLLDYPEQVDMSPRVKCGEEEGGGVPPRAPSGEMTPPEPPHVLRHGPSDSAAVTPDRAALPIDAATSMKRKQPRSDRHPRIGVIGAGNFAKATLLPALAKTDADLRYVADLDPVAAQHAAAKFGAREAVTDYRLILEDPEVDAVSVLVGHHLHARFVCEALHAGKHVHVEKPLALSKEQVLDVRSAYRSATETGHGQILMVGFNRRFSPHIRKVKALLSGRSEPVCMSMTINAGSVPADHWVQDPERGGGRIIGEACHFFDAMAFLVGSQIVSVSAAGLGGTAGKLGDNVCTILRFADGSIGTVNYFANGSKSYPKEILEVFSEGRVLRMENYRTTRAYGVRGFRSYNTRRQDKGHRSEMRAFLEAVRGGGDAPVPLAESINITFASFAAVTSVAEGRVVAVEDGIQFLSADNSGERRV